MTAADVARSPTTVATMLHLFDTARGEVVPFEARDPGRVSMYVCGPTVYGPPHLGHGRFSVVFDVLRRYLRWAGNDVTYVSNITDIDDKIIARAAEVGVPTDEFAAENEAIWWAAMDAIGVLRPTHDPHATAYVPEMVEIVGRPRRAGRGLRGGGRRVLPRRLGRRLRPAGPSVARVVAGRRPGGGPGGQASRRSTSCSGRRPSPASPRGRRRGATADPGWHTECVVMSLDLLGDGFDIHGGGLDLAFPHHENERAQAVAVGRRSAQCWVHNGFVEVGGDEDVQVARQLHEPGRPHRPAPTRAPSAWSCCRRTTGPRSRSTRQPWPTREAALARLDAFVRRADDGGRRARAARHVGHGPFRRRDGRRPRHARRLRRAVRHRAPGERGHRRGDLERAAPLCRRRPRDRGGARASSSAHPPRPCLTTSATGRPPATRPARRRTGPAPTPCATSWSRAGWLVEDTPSGTQVRPPDASSQVAPRWGCATSPGLTYGCVVTVR